MIYLTIMAKVKGTRTEKETGKIEVLQVVHF